MANQHAEESEIRAITEEWVNAARAGDIARLKEFYTPDLIAYDAVLQLQFVGRDSYIKHWEFCLGMSPDGTMIFEEKDLAIHAGNDVAFSYSLVRCGGRDEEGNEKTSWMRATRGLRKINGKWLAVHEHFSAPFDMESGKALFDLKP